ncbi:hypothetical protein FJZ20_01285 [Candidatus Pacearchaeota archaeon]|nr:hypothetical protein [Candidatus Pacearchaeota archaeon]
MLNKFIKDAMSLVAGKPAEDITDLLDTPKYVNEFIIAKKLNLTVNQIRNILYKASDYGLVSSTRKKDKRKGWYTYFWKIEPIKCLEFLRNEYLKRLEQLEHQAKSRETKRFYFCDRCNIELNEENALIHNFTCNECGSIFTLKDNTKSIKEMRKIFDKLKKDLIVIEEEIRKENEKNQKKKSRERNKEEKKKKAISKSKRLLKKKTAEKNIKIQKKKKTAKKKKAVKKKFSKKIYSKKSVKKKISKKFKNKRKTRKSK